MAFSTLPVHPNFPQQNPPQYTGDLIDSLFEIVERVDQPVPDSSELPTDQEDDIELERRLRRIA